MSLTRAICRHCRRLLCRLHLEGGSTVEIKCGHCNTLNTMTAQPVDLVPDGMGGFKLDTTAPQLSS